MFERLSEGDWQSIVEGLAEDVHHAFPGDHPLGGERNSREAVARWFERLVRLFPGHEFAVPRVVAKGWPWQTWVIVQWTARLRPQGGETYSNDGTHWICISWGKVTYFHAYLDTERVAEACRQMVSRGIEEAGADPISD